jgi:Ca2+-dependent lipid-binding protein
LEEITKVDNDCPKGIVEVTVFGVKDVAAMDSNGKSDPYIKIIVGGIT